MLPVVAFLAFQPHRDPTRVLIEKRLSELNEATKAMDGHRVALWMKANATKDFFYRAWGGQILTADQTVEMLRQEFNGTVSVKRSDFKVSNFGVHGDHLSCSVTSNLVLALKGGKRFASTSTSVDTWVRKDGAWKIASVVTTSEMAK